MDLKKIIIEYQEFIQSTKVTSRDYQIDKRANYVFTGIRRAGKTWFLFQIIHQYFSDTPEQILYINFEDERFIDFKVTDFDKLMDAFSELYPSVRPVLFLDEIQNIEGWQKFCRRMADQKYQVFVTGSNAKMLSSDIASSLGGRFLTIEIGPLSFVEFIRFNGVSYARNELHGHKVNLIKNLFAEYYHYGGFPEIISFENKKEYLHTIYTTVLYNDIVLRNNIRDIHSLRLLIKKIAESSKDEISYNRLKNLLVETGAKVGTSTVISWIDSLKNAFIIREIKNIQYKFTDREVKKKYYFSDNGLLLALGEQSEAKYFETLVFNALRYFFDELWFFNTGNAEVDFLVPEKALFQACFDFKSQKTREGEIKSLVKAANFLSVDTLIILTYNHEEEIIIKSHKISILPLWKYIIKQANRWN